MGGKFYYLAVKLGLVFQDVHSELLRVIHDHRADVTNEGPLPALRTILEKALLQMIPQSGQILVDQPTGPALEAGDGRLTKELLSFSGVFPFSF